MSARLNTPEGELVAVRITVDPRLLEELLDTLGQLPFPVNPEIRHHTGDHPDATVEFPAYENRLDEVRARLAGSGIPQHRFEVEAVLDSRH